MRPIIYLCDFCAVLISLAFHWRLVETPWDVFHHWVYAFTVGPVAHVTGLPSMAARLMEYE
jgi:hypothetical protein